MLVLKPLDMSALLKFALLGFEIALCHKKKEKLFVDFITACKPNYQQSITQSQNMLGQKITQTNHLLGLLDFDASGLFVSRSYSVS